MPKRAQPAVTSSTSAGKALRRSTGDKTVPASVAAAQAAERRAVAAAPAPNDDSDEESLDPEPEAHENMVGKHMYNLCLKHFTRQDWVMFQPEKLGDAWEGDEHELRMYPLTPAVVSVMKDWAVSMLEDKGVDVDALGTSSDDDEPAGVEEEGEEEDDDEDEEDEEGEENARIAAVEDGGESEEEEEEEAAAAPAPAPVAAASSSAPLPQAVAPFDPMAALGLLGGMCQGAIARCKVGGTTGIDVDALPEEDDAEEEGSEFEPSDDEEEEDDDDDSDAYSVCSDGSGFDDAELKAIKQASSAAASTAIVPANMGENAMVAYEEATDMEVDTDDTSDKSKIATLERKNRLLRQQNVRVCTDNSTLREANATLCHALRQGNLPIPAGAQQTAQALGQQLALTAAATPLMAGIAPPPPDDSSIATDALIKDTLCMRQLWLPDTSTLTASTKFKLNGRVWPHAICTYQRLQDDLAPCVEADSKQIIEFQLFDRRDRAKKVTEQTLAPQGGSMPIINFKLECVYDDGGEPVTIQSLAADKRERVRQLADPTCFNNNWIVPMDKGRVKFVVNQIYFRSGMTNPIHRKFRYKLTAVDQQYAFLNTHSPSFWVIAKAWKITNRNYIATTHV